MALLATLITQLRTLARDLPTSNRSVEETPKGLNDGSNTNFRLSSPILIDAAHIWWTSDGTFRSQTGISIVDANLGYIAISPAPPVGTQNQPFYVDYYYNWFADSDYTEFLNDGSRDLVGNGNPTVVIDALVSALLQYALSKFYQARATQYAARYSSSGGQAGQNVDVVTKNFQTLAKQSADLGEKLRDQYYEDLGQRETPASGTINYRIDPMTPKR